MICNKLWKKRYSRVLSHWIQFCRWISRTSTLGSQGWGLLSQLPLFHHFPNFLALSKHTFTNEYHVCIWQVLPQLNCSGKCQYKWDKKKLRGTFTRSKILLTAKLTNSFNNLHPWSAHLAELWGQVHVPWEHGRTALCCGPSVGDWWLERGPDTHWPSLWSEGLQCVCKNRI